MERKDSSKKVDHQVFERRVLYVALACSVLATVIFLIAASTEEWCSVGFEDWTLINTTRNITPPTYSKGYNIGLWRLCVNLYRNATSTSPALGPEKMCRMVTMYPSEEQLKRDPNLDYTLMHYRRSTSAMSIITLLLAPLAIAFSWYSIKEPRYMFKRLAGSLQLMTAGTAMICIEVFRSMLHHINDNLPQSWFPETATFSYGFSFGFAWTSFILFIGVGLAFFWYSRKRKRDKARSAREAYENEPVQLGRI